ncbi:MAG TPA: glutamate--tRNA ligase family protein, partial [Candidatus Cloacimonadota bacterium]|nr:glutamate--tRNA ligase family protein [Candidatus Cloacimonadota bacterium]
DRTKLSKRMNDVSVESYLEKGYLPEALLNFVALLGWHGADDREIYSLDELCSQFSLERVNKAGAVFDLAKLDWMNGWYLRNLPLDDVIRKSIPYFASSGLTLPSEQALSLIVNAARERCNLLPEIAEYGRMFLEPISLGSAERELISTPESQKVLRWFLESLSHLEEVSKEELDSLVKHGMAELGLKGKLFYTPLRIALIGRQHGPDLHTIVSILTHKVTINRLQESIETNG